MMAYRERNRGSGRTLLPTITFSTPAEALDANDVLADTQELAGAFDKAGGSGILQSIKLVDGDDNTAAVVNVFIFRSSVSLGTEDAAISISDANLVELLAVVEIAATDWHDTINSKVAYKSNLGIPVAVTTGTSLYVALQCEGTPTQTASGLTGQFGILQD